MWTVAKHNPGQSRIFKETMKKILGEEIEYYQPKIVISLKKRKIFKNILGDYIFCNHKKFLDEKNLKSLQYVKGLSYFLPNYKSDQSSITMFLEKCKMHEGSNKVLQPSFFDDLIELKAKFLTGPFKNLVFDIINRNKNNIIAKINNLKITVKSKEKYYFPL